MLYTCTAAMSHCYLSEPSEFTIKVISLAIVHVWINHEPALLSCKQEVSQQLAMVEMVFCGEEQPLLL